MYNVVFKRKSGTHKGVITWSTFKDKEYFDTWFDAKIKEDYEIVAENVSILRATELCSTPLAKISYLLVELRELSVMLR